MSVRVCANIGHIKLNCGGFIFSPMCILFLYVYKFTGHFVFCFFVFGCLLFFVFFIVVLFLFLFNLIKHFLVDFLLLLITKHHPMMSTTIKSKLIIIKVWDKLVSLNQDINQIPERLRYFVTLTSIG